MPEYGELSSLAFQQRVDSFLSESDSLDAKLFERRALVLLNDSFAEEANHLSSLELFLITLPDFEDIFIEGKQHQALLKDETSLFELDLVVVGEYEFPGVKIENFDS